MIASLWFVRVAFGAWGLYNLRDCVVGLGGLVTAAWFCVLIVLLFSVLWILVDVFCSSDLFGEDWVGLGVALLVV